MLRCLEVVVPGPWWNTLTYTFDSERTPEAGVRVRVPLGRGERVGFVASISDPPQNLPAGLKPAGELLDETPALGDELWGLACWIGRTFLCGTGEALQLVCPKPLLQGELIQPLSPRLPLSKDDGSQFREIHCYNPLDDGRNARYLEMLADGGRTLLLLPEAESAAAFFAHLPKELKADALLWPSSGGKKLWDSWKKVRAGEVRIVVGSGGAVFAPFSFETFVIDDESNPGYIFQRAPRIPARSAAGRRALTLRARLVLGGRMPSARTWLRSRPECTLLPQRRNFVFVDMARSFKKEVRGIEGELPVTQALLERTRATLSQGRSVFWIMDRRGQAGEVYCSDCGNTLFCPRCGSIMRSELDGSTLRCVQCGAREPLPDKCPTCRGILLRGKRPGLEALLPLAVRYVKGHPVLSDDPKLKSFETPSLLLGTRRLLSRCDSIDVGLVAWLDLDAEARKTDYNARFQTFSMVWESCWRGLRGDAEQADGRVILMQSRRPGSAWQSTLWTGWGNFWKNELSERKNLGLPPWGLLVQIDPSEGEDRSALVRNLEEAGLFIMDSGDRKSPLWVTVKSIDRLRSALVSRFGIKHSRVGFPVVTVWAD